MHAAQEIHRKFHNPAEVQLCRLLSIKTGGCPEDCAYCPQSAHYESGVEQQSLMNVAEVRRAAEEARAEGATRFCMGAAWREVRDGQEFETVLEMVRSVASLGLEVCCTLGMLTRRSGAAPGRGAGLTAYNHNLDTSPEFYGQIITTRHYDDRLRTIESVRSAGISVCCGGIIGMGESDEDRIGLLHQLASLRPHPESVPINMLVRVEGTPLADQEPVDSFTMVRMIAAARVLMPASRVRLSAGRRSLTPRGGGLVLPRRGQFHLRRRQAADHAQPGARRRRPVAPRSRLASLRPWTSRRITISSAARKPTSIGSESRSQLRRLEIVPAHQFLLERLPGAFQRSTAARSR